MELLTIENVVVFLFVLTYLLVVLFYQKKTYFVWGAIFLILVLRALSPFEAFTAINWNVIGIYVGMLFISEMFIYSDLPEVIAEKIVTKSKYVWTAMIGVCLFSGIMSVAVENVAVVLIIYTYLVISVMRGGDKDG